MPGRARSSRAVRPSIIDVARVAGVAVGTVSNVINNRAVVAEATRSRVLAAIEELGYVRNRSAGSLARGRSTTIGCVVIDLSNSFFLDMCRGARNEASTSGHVVLLADSDSRPEEQAAYLDVFMEERVSGIVLAPVPGSEAAVRRLLDHDVRTVLLDARLPGGEVCCVVPDNVEGGYLAARHLVRTGRRHLLYVGDLDLTPVADRWTGVQRAVAEADGVTVELLRTPSIGVTTGHRAGQDVVARPRGSRPDGVVAADDLTAVGILQSLLAGGVDVPSELGLIGYDDNRASWDSVIPISTVSQPGEQMGRTAAQLLLDELVDPQGHRHRTVVLHPELVVRASTGG